MQDAQKYFELHSEYKPTGDQPQAIEALVKGFQEVWLGAILGAETSILFIFSV